MPIDEKNLIRHEIIGLHAKIEKSSDSAKTKIHGIIINETQKTITIRTKLEEKQIPKKECTFIITIPSGEQIKVDGILFYGRPEERIKKKLPKKWDVL